VNRRYLVLIAAVLAGAALVNVLARLPRHAASRPAPAAAVPSVELEVTLEAGRLSPEAAAVPKGHRVRLVVVNRESGPRSLRLAGYEDRVAVAAIAPGAAWRDSFLADRPGEGFAWIVDGQPAGRLVVTGSHLVEGHK
jgi:hypothetical protein